MVAVIGIGKSMRRAFFYNENKVQSEDASLLKVSNMPSEKCAECPDLRLKMLLKLTSTRPDVKTNTVHISLNFSPEERLTDDKMSQIATDYMEKIGFEKQPYLVYRHKDSGHEHMHIVSTNITYDGERISLHNIGSQRSEPARKEIETKYRLVRAEDQKKQPFELKPADFGKVQYGRLPTKRAISAVLIQVLDQYKYTSIAELNAVLSLYNVRVDTGEEGSRLLAHDGLQYRILDQYGQTVGKPVKASSFYNQATLKNLQKRFIKNNITRQLHKKTLAAAVLFTLKSKRPSSLKELSDLLKRDDIRLIPRIGKEGVIFGITYIDMKNKTVFNGRDLGKEFAAKALLERLHLPQNDNGNTIIVGSKMHEKTVFPVGNNVARSWESYLQLDQKSMMELLSSYEYAASAVPNVWKKKKRKKRK